MSLKVFVDTKDAMGANMQYHFRSSDSLSKNELTDQEILMSILSNHATSSVVRVEGEIDINDLNRGDYSGEEVAKRMERASVLASRYSSGSNT